MITRSANISNVCSINVICYAMYLVDVDCHIDKSNIFSYQYKTIQSQPPRMERTL